MSIKMCIYEFTMYFKKTFKTLSQTRNNIPASTQTKERYHRYDKELVVETTEHDRFMGKDFQRKWTFVESHPTFSVC